jgi:hypothetical protein
MEATKVHLNLQAWAEQYGPIYKLRMGQRKAVAISDPHMVNELLRARPETFRRSAHLDRVISEIGVNGVFNAEGDAGAPNANCRSQRSRNAIFASSIPPSRRWRKD